jgi:alpha-N-arabinofuranosidase
MKAHVLLLMWVMTMGITGQNQYSNPILRGSHPDPSICKAGDEYYIVNSTFEYYPGLPIHKSKDLVNWELVGYGLHRKEQCTGVVNLVDVQSDGGIHAPTIRFHNGMFYIITTNVYYNADESKTDFVNFIITAEKAEGPWSEPHVLEGAPGIDPDIFFDDDGKVWYVGTHSPEDPNFQGEGEIWLQEIDLDNWRLTGERHYLWRGACGGVWAEGPHMYKHDGRYYLMIAEGGTSYNHAVMIAVSDSIQGPYLSNERNPILTTRHLSYDNWVHSTGHADLLQVDDRWYMVALGVRGDEQRNSNMGRESFLVPVQWEREPFDWKEIKYDWPEVSPLTGKLEKHYPVPFANTKQHLNKGFSDNFDDPQLNLRWCWRRVPLEQQFLLNVKPGKLRIKAHGNTIKERGRANFIGFRQTESEFVVETKMDFKPKTLGSEAGLVMIQKDNNYISYTVKKTGQGQVLQVVVEVPAKGKRILHSTLLKGVENGVKLKVVSKNHQYHYCYQLQDGSEKEWCTSSATLILNRGYTGAYLGLYATSNGKRSKDYADFDWVSYQTYQE